MEVDIREIVVKYFLIFLDIFITIFFIFNLINFNNIEFCFINYLKIFGITFLIFCTYLLYKIVKFVCMLFEFMNFQMQLEAIKQEIKQQEENDKRFNDLFNSYMQNDNDKEGRK